MKLLLIFGAKYLIAVLILFFLYFFIMQNKNKKALIIKYSLITLPLAYVIAKLSSLFYYDPRPFVVGNFTPLISHAADNGFPSDHTLLSSTLAAVAYYFNKKWGTLLFVLAVLVGLSRVLAGVHHFVDIIGSIIISIISSLVVAKIAMPYFQKTRE